MKLQQLSTNDGELVFYMLQRIGANENAFKNEVNGMTFEEYKIWLKKMDNWAEGKDLPEGYVRQWTYWLIDNNDIPIGYGKIREKLTNESRKFGGNLGFAIDPEFRGKGYGNILFKLLLDEARKKEINEIISTVEKYNYSSKKVHENCGGILFDENDERWFFKF